MKKCTIIYNPISGRGRTEKEIPRVRERVESLGFTCNIKRTQRPGNAVDLAEKASADNTDLLVIVGGDGTFNECLNGLMRAERRPLVGFVPAGTSCDIARTLGISKKTHKSLDTIAEGHSANMDIVRTNQGYFTYVGALGNYVDISYQTSDDKKEKLGYLAYVLSGVKQFFRIKKIRLTIDDGKESVEGTFSLVLVVNSRHVAGFKVIDSPVLDDGRIDLVTYRHIPFLNNLLYALSFLFDTTLLPGIRHQSVAKARILSEDPYRWSLDGERGAIGLLDFEVEKQALRVLINGKKRQFFPNQSLRKEW